MIRIPASAFPAFLAAVTLAVLAWPSAAPAQTLFDRMDTNHDGLIQPAEFQAAYPDTPADTFGQLDVDGDGTLTHGEWADGRSLMGLGQGKGQGGAGQGMGQGMGQGQGKGKGAGNCPNQ